VAEGAVKIEDACSRNWGKRSVKEERGFQKPHSRLWGLKMLRRNKKTFTEKITRVDKGEIRHPEKKGLYKPHARWEGG